MDIGVRLTVRKDLRIAAPQYALPPRPAASLDRAGGGYHVCTGIGPDLYEAAQDAIRAMIDYLGQHHGRDRQEAYAIASVAADLKIHELVDAPNWVVGAFLPLDIFDEEG